MAFVLCCAILWRMLNSRHTLGLAWDKPNARSLHVVTVPRVGGLALVPAVAMAWWWLGLAPSLMLLSMIALAAISYIDDWRGLSAVIRFGAHTGTAALFVWNGYSVAGWWFVLLIVLALVWMINLYNFMDGADGLAGGMAFFGFAVYGIAAIIAGASQLAAMSFSVAAAALAFLFFNFHPARIFLGDAGSVPLGFLAAAIGLQGWAGGLWPLWFTPLVFAPFVADATVTLVRRLLHGEKVWQAHREHYYQRLVRMGWGHRKTALAEYGLMIASGILAVLLLHSPQLVQIIALLAWCALLALLMYLVDQRWRAYVMAMECGA